MWFYVKSKIRIFKKYIFYSKTKVNKSSWYISSENWKHKLYITSIYGQTFSITNFDTTRVQSNQDLMDWKLMQCRSQRDECWGEHTHKHTVALHIAKSKLYTWREGLFPNCPQKGVSLARWRGQLTKGQLVCVCIDQPLRTTLWPLFNIFASYYRFCTHIYIHATRLVSGMNYEQKSKQVYMAEILHPNQAEINQSLSTRWK